MSDVRDMRACRHDSGGLLVQQRDALAAAAVRHRHVTRAHERLPRALRQQRAAKVLHRQVGNQQEPTTRSYMVSTAAK